MEWFKFKGVNIGFFKNVKYKSKIYPIYFFKTDLDKNHSKISAGSFRKVRTEKVILINYKVYKNIPEDELNSLIKHELIHAHLNHSNRRCSKENYIKKHKEEVYPFMTKKELIAQISLDKRYSLK